MNAMFDEELLNPNEIDGQVHMLFHIKRKD